VPGPTSILDRVALAEAYEERRHRPIREAFEDAPRRGALRFSRARGATSRRRRVVRAVLQVLLLGSVPLAVILALRSLGNTPATIVQLVCGAVIVCSAWMPWHDNRQLGAVRWLRTSPVEWLHDRVAGGAVVDGNSVRSLSTLVQSRSRLHRSIQSSTRARDVTADPVRQRWHQTAFGMAFVMLAASAIIFRAPPVFTGLLYLAAVIGAVVHINRRRLSVRCDSRQAAGRCPDCDYDLASVPSDPVLRGAGLDFGPRRCPECAVWWPLVPPPTVREVIEGNQPLIPPKSQNPVPANEPSHGG